MHVAKFSSIFGCIIHRLPQAVAQTRMLDIHAAESQLKHRSARVAVWDGWRGLAVLLVLSGHFLDISWIWEDRMGVDIFFVLSGMLMSSILFEQRLSLRDFYIRRFSRILPVFILCTLCMYSIAWVFKEKFYAQELLANLFFIRAYLPVEPGMWDTTVAVGHLWSLNVEEHAYIIMSVMTLFLVRPKAIAWWLIALAALAIVMSFNYYLNSTKDELLPLISRTETAGAFIFFSAGYGLLKRKHNWILPCWAPVALFALGLGCYVNILPIWLVFAVSPVLLGIAVNHLQEIPQRVADLLSSQFFRLFGLWSYSIYLWQQVFYQYSYKIPGGSLVACILAIGTGVVSFYLFENPLRRWINNRWSATPVYAGDIGFNSRVKG